MRPTKEKRKISRKENSQRELDACFESDRSHCDDDTEGNSAQKKTPKKSQESTKATNDLFSMLSRRK